MNYANLTQEQREDAFSRRIDNLDRKLLSGQIGPAEYDSRCKELQREIFPEERQAERGEG